MFKVGKYKVVFKRNIFKNNHQTVCTVTVTEYPGQYDYCGLANLHPKDQPDKVTGKKQSLKDAMVKTNFANKHERTLIWKAFWVWVESWKPV